MGKNQHSKDRMFITATEQPASRATRRRRLLTDRVTVGLLCFVLLPFDSPVCARDGILFDALQLTARAGEWGLTGDR